MCSQPRSRTGRHGHRRDPYTLQLASLAPPPRLGRRGGARWGLSAYSVPFGELTVVEGTGSRARRLLQQRIQHLGAVRCLALDLVEHAVRADLPTRASRDTEEAEACHVAAVLAEDPPAAAR